MISGVATLLSLRSSKRDDGWRKQSLDICAFCRLQALGGKAPMACSQVDDADDDICPGQPCCNQWGRLSQGHRNATNGEGSIEMLQPMEKATRACSGVGSTTWHGMA